MNNHEKFRYLAPRASAADGQAVIWPLCAVGKSPQNVAPKCTSSFIFKNTKILKTDNMKMQNKAHVMFLVVS